MMTHICPYCGGRMTKPPPEYDMSIKQGIVYNLIVAAGPEGVSVDALQAGLFKGMSPISIRSSIYRINKIIRPKMIRAHHKFYSLQD